MADSLDVSIVIPTFNEANRLGATLERIVAFSKSYPSKVDVIISDDGSVDGTCSLAGGFEADLSIRVLRLPHRGPGNAIAQGVLSTDADWIVLSDADGPVPFDTIGAMIQHAQSHEVDVLSGRRVGPGAVIQHPQPLYRRCMGVAWRAFVRRGVGLPFIDPQCGFKLFRGSVSRTIFAETRSTSFGIHVEAMLLARAFGYTFEEFPVVWGDRDGSKIRPIRDALRMTKEVFDVERRIQVLHKRKSDSSYNETHIS